MRNFSQDFDYIKLTSPGLVKTMSSVYYQDTDLENSSPAPPQQKLRSSSLRYDLKSFNRLSQECQLLTDNLQPPPSHILSTETDFNFKSPTYSPPLPPRIPRV